MDKAKIIKPGLGLLAVLLISIIWWLQTEPSPIAQAGQPLPQALVTTTISPTSGPNTPPINTTPEAHTDLKPTIAWSDAPICENLPQNLAAWLLYAQEALNNPVIVTQLNNYLHQAEIFDPVIQSINFEDLLGRLNEPRTAETTQVIIRELTVLWLNIVSGRLNQATELEIPGQPEIETVADLIAQLEQALGGGDLPPLLVEASQQLQAGQNISRHICGRLIYRTGSEIRESLWTAGGYLEHDTSIPKVPFGITSFSPDYTKLIVETAATDTGGGPLYLFDLETRNLLNLNQRLGLKDHLGPMGLAIGGWHPDSNHFLLRDLNNDAVIWANSETDTYQQINLNQDAAAPVRHIALTPDGNSLIYLVDDANNEANLRRYDFESQSVTPLTTFGFRSNQLTSFRLSPIGDRLAYVIKKGQRQSGLSYSLELLNLTTFTRTLLIEGNLGRTEPVWSPDGQKIAFIRKTQDTPDVGGDNLGQAWEGNIWIASVSSGDVQQVTFVDGAAYQPVWSPDSRFLAFITHNGEIGLVAVEQPGLIWRLGTTLPLSQMTSLNFVP